MTALFWGTMGGLIAAGATALGAFASVWRPKSGANPWRFMTLDFALGMMLAAAAFAMILPASEEAAAAGPVMFGSTVAAVIGGGVFIRVLGRWLANSHQATALESTEAQGGPSAESTRATLFIIAMMLHNLPEGLASGAALSGLNPTQGFSVLAAIALQNVPEGLTTALAFRGLGASPRTALFGALASAGVELIGGIAGGSLLLLSNALLPMLLAFAGGAMLTVSVAEVRERLVRWQNSRTQIGRDGGTQIVRDIASGALAMLLLNAIL